MADLLNKSCKSFLNKLSNAFKEEGENLIDKHETVDCDCQIFCCENYSEKISKALHKSVTDCNKTAKSYNISKFSDNLVLHNMKKVRSSENFGEFIDIEEIPHMDLINLGIKNNNNEKTAKLCFPSKPSIENKVEFHDKELLDIYLIQLGIKRSLEDVSNVHIDVRLIEATGSNTIKNTYFEKHNFKFVAYAPIAFRIFRETLKIDEKDFMRSVCDEPLLRIPSFDKRYSNTFLTMDGQYMLRFCSEEEAFFLKIIFQGYFLNMTYRTESLLPKYFGMFKYTRASKEAWLIIMNNYLPTCINFQDLYFLKGSTRRSGIKAGQYESYIGVSGNTPLKDLDFVENCHDGFFLPEETYERLMECISRDCKFLETYEIMNYSLVLGLCSPSQLTKSQRNAGPYDVPFAKLFFSQALNRSIETFTQPLLALSSKGEEVYLFLSFANTLKSYDFKRKFESLAKSCIYENATISVNSPAIYSSRFQDFLAKYVLKCLHTSK